MKVYFKDNWIFLVLFAPLLSSCLITPKQNTRYIAYYQNFERVDAPQPTWVQWGERETTAPYQTFFIDGVSVYEDPAKKIPRGTRPDYDAFAEQMEKVIKARFRGKFNLVDKPGPDTLILKFRIVDIKPSAWMTNEDGQEFFITNTNITGTKFEVDCRDAQSGERVFALTTLYEGDTYEAHQDLLLMPFVEEAFAEWREWVRSILDKALEKNIFFNSSPK